MFRTIPKLIFGTLLPLLAAAGCADKPTSVQSGTLASGTMRVLNSNGNVEAYPPAFGEPPERYTVTATAREPNIPTRIRWDAGKRLLTVCPARCRPAADIRVDYIVRVPHGIHALIQTSRGSLHISDVDGPVDAIDQDGDIKIQVPGYAQAFTRNGNISATFGDAQWPGVLKFFALRGNVEVYVPAQARAQVHLHTDHGSIFTDFELRGTSNGNAETIDAPINGGGNRSVVLRAVNGDIRLLKLTPQM